MEILSGIISKVIECTVEPVGRHVGYLINYKSNLESLRSQLKNLDAAKDRMKHRVDEVERNGKGVETDVQNWRKEADGITQEAEKILGNEGQAKTKCFRGVCPNLVSYHQFSRKSAKLEKKIELHAKKEFPSVSYEAPVEDISAIPSQEYMAFESRTSMLKEIMEELKNPDTNRIGVYGLGGVGKTTLAKEVFREANKEKLFDDVVIILNVKEKNDMEIQKEIAEKLGMEVKEPQSMAVRANCLWRRIKDKKTLVILDDVSTRIDLETVGLVHVQTCNLLLTSRDKEVLFSEMGTQKNFPLDLLREQESLSLFEKKAGAVIKDDRIQRVANELAKKCGGLPILVVAVASGLRESSLEEWKDTLRRFKNFEKKGLTEIAFLIIEWSYNKLDSEELRPLFLLCAIMAEGKYALFLSDLLKYSIGLGLVENVRTVEEARNALHSLVKKLKNSCLLLDGYDDGSVRMHDVVRDVAVRIASRDQHALSRAYTELDESPSKDCTLISLRRCTIPKLPDVPWECPELKFFYLGSSDNSLEIPCNFFEKMKELRVLDLTALHFRALPPSLQSLTNLQTLCLDQCVLGDIALVGQLTNLKILSLIQSQVKELPKEIGQLTRLQLLDLTRCSQLVVIPAGVISSLTSLEDLRMGSFKEWEGGLNDGRSNASVSELKQLHQLTALDICIPDAKLLPANMFSDTKLERYTVLIGDCWLYPDNYGTSSNMLKLKLTTSSQFDEGIKLLLKRCEHLDLDGMEAANIISYILASDSGKQLKNLHVQNNDEVAPLINSSHAFPNLESLSLDNLANLETVCCGQLIAQPFRKLRSLTLRNLPKLIGFSSKGSRPVVTTEAEEIIPENEIGGPTTLFMNGEVGFPSLEKLIIYDLPALGTIWHNQLTQDSCCRLKKVEVSGCDTLINIFPPSLMGRLNALGTLVIKQCKSLQVVFDVKEAYGTSRTQLKTFECPNLSLVVMDSCESLKNIFPTSVAKGLQQLCILHVENCGILEEIVGKEGVETTPTKEFVFSKVTLMKFVNLPQLRSFYPGLHVSKWPLLKGLEFYKCGKVEIFASEYSRFQERPDSGLVCTPIKQPFFLVDKVLAPNLTLLILHQCDGLRFLFSCSMARSLVQLEHIKISKCQMMEEVVKKIGSSEEDMDNIFPKLEHLQLQHLPSLTRFCSKSENVTVGKQTEERDMKDYIETNVQYFLLDEKVGFPSLERLIIRDMPKLRTIWHCQLDPESFRKLKLVEVLRCHSLINIFGPSMMGRLNALGKLVIKQCKSLQVIFDVKEAYGTSRTQLKTFGCPNLELAIMDSCESLKNIFPASVAKGLQQLRELIVWNCGILEEIFAKEGVETTPEFVFPKVTTMIFWTLPQLRSFYPGLHVSKWPLLKENDDRNSKENLETVIPHFLFDEKVGFPSLERLTIWGLPKLMTIWHNRLAPNSFCKLKEVEVLRCDTLIKIFASSMIGRLNALHTLRINKCKSLQLVFDVKEAYGTSRTQLKTFGCPNLELVMMDSCDSVKNIFPASVAKGLQQLRELSVENCGILEEIVAKEGVETTPTEEFVFPNVTLAKFGHLPQLRSFYPGLHVSKWPLLEDLRFFECGKVEIFASEYSRFQERLYSGTPIKQPFLLIDKDNPFPNLKKLGLDENKEIWYEAHGPLPTELFINLKILRFSCVHPNSFAFVQKLHGLEELIVIGGPWKEIFGYEGISSEEIDAVGRTFPRIKNLGLVRVQELMHLGNDDCKTIFPNLKILKVCECGRLKNLTSSAISFRNLTTLEVVGCEGLKYLTTYSVAKRLHQLKELEVVDCKSMIEIVASNGDEQDSGNYYEIAFSSLQYLKLSNLPILRGFCSSEIFTIRVPSLNS